MDNQEILDRINAVKYWRHRIQITDDIVTPGTGVFDFHYHDMCRGKSVLDVGAWDGYFSFKAEREGAAHVLATDVWEDPPARSEWWETIRNGDEGIRVAKEVLGSGIEHRNIGVYDLSQEEVGRFDLVMCLGVLYHLRHPLLALEKLAEVCSESLLIETAVADFAAQPERADVTVSGRDLEQHPLMLSRGASGWFPNVTCTRRMLELVGFRRIEDLSSEVGVPNRRHARRFGRTVESCALRSSNGDEVQLNQGEPVIVLNTELGNMDVDHEDAKLLRVERWRLGKYQGWVEKQNVEFIKGKPKHFVSPEPFGFGRVLLRAWK